MSRPGIHRLFTPVDLIGIGGIVLIAVVAHFGGFEPVRRARAENAMQQESLTALNEAKGANAAALRDVKARLDELGRFEGRSVRLEHASKLNQRMAAIPELADRCAIRVREVVPKAAQPAKRFVRVPITIAGEGPAARISVFLSQLHLEFPDMEVVSFSIAGRADSPTEAAFFTFDLLWYTSAGPDASTAAAAGSKPSRP
ncbi:hypothetical protein PHYC_02590 [Phycisphaerales bacterium]|nr:hypothetical protein PHYC_02590 [Phycisphaerales bacterium]